MQHQRHSSCFGADGKHTVKKWGEVVAVGQTLRSISSQAGLQLLSVLVTLMLSLRSFSYDTDHGTQIDRFEPVVEVDGEFLFKIIIGSISIIFQKNPSNIYFFQYSWHVLMYQSMSWFHIYIFNIDCDMCVRNVIWQQIMTEMLNNIRIKRWQYLVSYYC